MPTDPGRDSQYDPHGDYIRAWLPQLAKVPTPRIQCPWTMHPSDRSRLIPAKSYPARPVLEQPGWRPHYNRKGPNKHGVPNRNERVRNPGPAIVGRAGRGSSADGDSGAGSADDKKAKTVAGSSGDRPKGGQQHHHQQQKPQDRRWANAATQTTGEARERESRASARVLEEAHKNGHRRASSKETMIA